MTTPERKDLNNRANINQLVNTFYAKVRADEMLGPIFNQVIQDWPAHLKRLTDFWERTLLSHKVYKGNPIAAHNKVDEEMGNSITMVHFGRWLQLWFSTIDENFEGENATLAKHRARKMSTLMFLAIFNNRKAARTQ
jgi:hemoglobin